MEVRAQFSIWWSNLIAWGYEHSFLYDGSIFWQPYGGTHSEAPKRKNAASLAL